MLLRGNTRGGHLGLNSNNAGKLLQLFRQMFIGAEIFADVINTGMGEEIGVENLADACGKSLVRTTIAEIITDAGMQADAQLLRSGGLIEQMDLRG